MRSLYYHNRRHVAVPTDNKARRASEIDRLMALTYDELQGMVDQLGLPKHYKRANKAKMAAAIAQASL